MKENIDEIALSLLRKKRDELTAKKYASTNQLEIKLLNEHIDTLTSQIGKLTKGKPEDFLR